MLWTRKKYKGYKVEVDKTFGCAFYLTIRDPEGVCIKSQNKEMISGHFGMKQYAKRCIRKHLREQNGGAVEEGYTTSNVDKEEVHRMEGKGKK